MTVKIPDHNTPSGRWCRFSGCDSVSGICRMCEPLEPVYWLRPVPDQDLSGPYTAVEARERLEAGKIMWPEQALMAPDAPALAAYVVMCRPSDAASLAAHWQNMADLHGLGVEARPFTIDLAPNGEREQFWTVTYTPEGWILTAGPGPDVTG